jgi:hypothetical protein
VDGAINRQQVQQFGRRISQKIARVNTVFAAFENSASATGTEISTSFASAASSIAARGIFRAASAAACAAPCSEGMALGGISFAFRAAGKN